MPVYKSNAIVLHRTNLGETDRILTLLCREAGKLNAVAKGARGPKSRLSGVSELFTHSRMLLAVGRSLDILSQGEIRESFPALRHDLALMARATYLCELTDRLVEEREPDPEVFDLLLSALYVLQRCGVDGARPDVIVHAYELRIMAQRGYAPELGSCVRCGAELLAGGRAAFSPSLGGALCSRHLFAMDDAIPLSPGTLPLMRELRDAEVEPLVALATADGPFHAAPAGLEETARCLRWYIRYRTDRELRSADFVDLLRATT